MSIEVKELTNRQRDTILAMDEGHFLDLKGKEIKPAKLTQVISSFANALHLFTAKTIHSLSLFHTRLRDLRNYHHIKLSLVNKKKGTDVEEFNEPILRAKANLACVACNELVRSPIEEGGLMPPPIQMIEWMGENVPPLPQSSFPRPMITISNLMKK